MNVYLIKDGDGVTVFDAGIEAMAPALRAVCAQHGGAHFKRMLPMWDAGAVAIVGTLAEGDEVAGFEVVELPGHAPGLIGLFRRSDRLALVSDTVCTLDIQTGRKGGPCVPHPAFDVNVEQAP